MTFKLASYRSLIAAFVPVVLAAAGITPARAQPAPEANRAAPQDPYDPDEADEADDAAPNEANEPDDTAPVELERSAPVAPPTRQPTMQPPPPPANPPPMSRANPAPAPRQSQPAASGQWVYTQQHGWLWMPYGDQYVYAPQTTADATGTVYPSEYVYMPSYGWTWLAAPWIWGWGPRVYFSIGPGRFHWFNGRGFAGHGVIRAPGFRGGVRGHFNSGHFGSSHFGGGHFGGGHFSGHRGHR